MEDTSLAEEMELEESSHIPIPDLRSSTKYPDPWYRLHVFIYDLCNFASDPTARNRLDSIVDTSYLDTPYFTAPEVTALKRTKVGSGDTLQ